MTTKQDIVEHLAKRNIDRSTAMRAIEGIIEALTLSFINGESVSLRGLATFKVKEVAEKVGRNISAGTAITIPAHKTVKLILSKELKNLMNNGTVD